MMISMNGLDLSFMRDERPGVVVIEPAVVDMDLSAVHDALYGSGGGTTPGSGRVVPIEVEHSGRNVRKTAKKHVPLKFIEITDEMSGCHPFEVVPCPVTLQPSASQRRKAATKGKARRRKLQRAARSRKLQNAPPKSKRARAA